MISYLDLPMGIRFIEKEIWTVVSRGQERRVWGSMVKYYLMNISFISGKIFRDWWWQWLYNNMRILKDIKLYSY